MEASWYSHYFTTGDVMHRLVTGWQFSVAVSVNFTLCLHYLIPPIESIVGFHLKHIHTAVLLTI